ncbi:MAG: aldehyde dehydrogenase family protein [Betaproteobacteria bacterium]|nr:aldehyde dehydrogenase family protein [Betaproteobacteria bacterium]
MNAVAAPARESEAYESGDRFFIGGRWVAPAAPVAIEVVDPSTERPFARVAGGNAADVDAAVAAAREAFATYSRSSREERLALLERILAVYRRRAGELAAVLSREMGVALSFAKAMQVVLGARHIEAAIDVLKSYPFERPEGTMLVRKEPIGVCGLITPWNWPLNQIACKVAPALAAGCTVVLKPSELSPFNALVFARVMEEADTPPGVFNLVNGTGDAVGAAMSSHPDIDMISLTGSTRAGVLVAKAAADTVKRVTLELGGKSANILLPDADFGVAVVKGVAAGFRNCGQSCSAPTRMLVPVERLDEVEALAKAAAESLVVGEPRAEATQLGPLANAAQFRKVAALIQAGIDEGAKLVAGGPGRPAGLASGFYVRPTVFSRVRPDMRIAREEIFGPVLSVIPYRDEEEAIAIANGTVYGLAGYVQSRDLEHARRVAKRLRAGQVHINYPEWSPFAAFGGFKQSGNGREYGVAGLEEYLETQTILGHST